MVKVPVEVGDKIEHETRFYIPPWSLLPSPGNQLSAPLAIDNSLHCVMDMVFPR